MKHMRNGNEETDFHRLGKKSFISSSTVPSHFHAGEEPGARQLHGACLGLSSRLLSLAPCWRLPGVTLSGLRFCLWIPCIPFTFYLTVRLYISVTKKLLSNLHFKLINC